MPKKKKIKFPKNMTEASVLEVIDKISKSLAYRFQFTGHDIEDIQQQAKLLALEGLGKYDGKRPLENFLWHHVHNRLFNFKRNNYVRPSCSCDTCKNKEGCKIDKMDCNTYQVWKSRAFDRINLKNPISIHDVDSDGESSMYHNVDYSSDLMISDILTILDREIPLFMRADYLKLKEGGRMKKHRKDRIIFTIQSILIQNNFIDEARLIKKPQGTWCDNDQT
jgi:hypothetical protein